MYCLETNKIPNIRLIGCVFLKNTEYENEKVIKNPNYKDRAGKRRETVGSEGNFHRDDAPASVHV